MIDVVERFTNQARRHPDALAVTDRGICYNYGKMHQLVQNLAMKAGKNADHPRVLILLEQGYHAYSAKYAALMAGGFYAPVNIEAPQAKIQQIACQFMPDVVISGPQFLELATLVAPQAHVINVAAEETSRPATYAARPAHDLAYVMFTSGTTGEPKGVMIPRDALNHYVDWVVGIVDARLGDRWSQHPIIAFDLSQFDIHGALCSGGHLFPFNTPRDRMFPALAIRRHGITIWNSVPSVISQMSRAGHLTAENLATLRTLNFCGEALLREHVEAVFSACRDASVHNTYGPTEATVSCTFLRLTRDNYQDHCAANVAIGEAIPGSAIHLVNGPNEDEGEIAITGVQLARGYWQDEEKTAGAFRPLHMSGGNERAYFTGDYAHRVEGKIFFAGRLDFQVKVRGRRLELLEVDAALRKCGFTHAATALVGDELHAFLETDLTSIDAGALRASLANHIEQHAVPAHFHLYYTLPRNPNDKIDVKALIASVKSEC